MILNTKNLNTEKKDVSFLEAGIHENVALVAARNETSQNGHNFIEVTFSKDGSTLKHTEYEPTNNGNMTQEQLDDRITKVAIRIKEILKAFYTEEQLEFEGDIKGFLAFATTMLNNANKESLVRLKAVYNDRGYITLPNYTVYTFIEPMTIETNKSKIKQLGIDKLVRPVTEDAEKPATSGAASFGAAPTPPAPF